MLGLALLTPVGLLALILALSSVERRLFGGHVDLRLRGLAGAFDPGTTAVFGDRAGGQDLTAGAEPPMSRTAGKGVSRRRRRILRRVDPDRTLRGGENELAGGNRVAPPHHRPTPTSDVGYLLPRQVFTSVSGECVRCGGDLSRGFAAARDQEGDLEAGVVCPCCEWLDDNEREQARLF